MIKFLQWILNSYGYMDMLTVEEEEEANRDTTFVPSKLTVSEYKDVWEARGYVIKRFIAWVLLLTFAILLVDNATEEDRPWGLVFLPLYILFFILAVFIILKYTNWGKFVPHNPVLHYDELHKEMDRRMNTNVLSNYRPETVQQLFFLVCKTLPGLVLFIRVFLLLLFLSLLISINVQLDRDVADRVSWGVVFIPLYIFLLMCLISIAFIYYMLPVFRKWKSFWSATWCFLCFLALVTSVIFIAIHLDNPSVFGSWVNVFIPAYVWFLLAFFYILFIVLIDHNMICYRKKGESNDELGYLEGMISEDRAVDLNDEEELSSEDEYDFDDTR